MQPDDEESIRRLAITSIVLGTIALISSAITVFLAVYALYGG